MIFKIDSEMYISSRFVYTTYTEVPKFTNNNFNIYYYEK